MHRTAQNWDFEPDFEISEMYCTKRRRVTSGMYTLQSKERGQLLHSKIRNNPQV
jgi:hypothetical protein